MATADDVVVEFEAKVDGYQADVKSAATTFDRSMKQIATSAANMDRATGTAFNNARISQQILMRVGRGLSEQYATSGLTMQLFTSHLGELAEAGTFAGGSLGKLGAFLGSGFGIATTLTVTALLPVIAHLIKTGDAVDDVVAKLKEHFEKTQLDQRAQEIFSRTVEGETQAVQDNSKAIAGLSLVHETAAQKALREAEAVRQNTIETEKNTIAKLQNAKAVLADTSGDLSAFAAAPNPARAQRQAQIIAQGQIDKIDADLKQTQANLAQAEKNVISARASVIVEQATATKEQKTNQIYDARIDAAKKLAIANGTVEASLKKQVEAIEAARQADLKRLRDADRAGKKYSDEQSGRDLSFAQAASIARAAGLQVNSGYRSVADQARLYNDPRVNRPGNPVARPGASAHNGANGYWALDIELAPGITPELLRKVFGAQGVSLTKVLREAGHFHIEGKQDQADVQAQKDAEAEAKKAQALDKQLATTQKRLDVEAQVNALRATGDDLLKERADQIEAEYQIESQFPELANSTNAADKDRLRTLKEIADQAIREKYAREGTTLIPKNLDETVKQGLHQMVEAADHASDELKRKQQEQIRTLAGFYEDMFRGGSHAIWRDFKQVGLSVIAEVLARFTASKLSGGGGNFDFGSALGAALGSVLPGFAGGGSMLLGGHAGTDRNVLSYNGQPIARVSSGETLNIGSPGLMRGGSATQVIVHVQANDYFDARVAGISHAVAAPIAQRAAVQMGSAVSRGVMQAMPSRLASYQRDGT